MAFFARQFLTPSSATSLTTALGLTDGLKATEITIDNLTGGSVAYVGNSGLTATTNRGAEIAAGGSQTFASYARNALDTDEIFVIGTASAANILLISVVT